jgi:putative oxidoreductase
MLSIFPSLLAFEGFSPLIIRLVLGITLAWFGYQKIKGRGHSSGSNSLIYGVIEVIVSIFLIIGLFTQVAALINALILVIKLGFKVNQKAFLTDGVNYYILLLAMAISLVFTGPGFIAFDLPL